MKRALLLIIYIYSVTIALCEPDSTLQMLLDVQPNYSQMSDKDKASYGLLLFKTMYNIRHEFPSEEYIDFSISYYLKHNDKIPLANSYYYKATMAKNQRKYTESIRLLLKSKDLLNPSKDHSLLGKIYFDLGQLSGYQGEFNKSLEYYDQAASAFGQAGENNNKSKVYLAIAWVYQAKEDFDNAILYSQKALELTTNQFDTGELLNNIGTCFHFKGEPDSALHYMYQSLDYPYYSTNMSLRYYNIANVYSSVENFDSAAVYVDKALQYPMDIYITEETYRILIRIALANDDKENLPKYLAIRQAAMDSIRMLEQQPNIDLLEEIHETGIQTASIKQQRLLLIILIPILLLTGILLLIHFYRRHQQQKAESEAYKAKLEQKQEILLLEFADELEQTKKKYEATRKKANFEQKEQIDKNIFNEVLHFDDEKIFINKMNKVLNLLPEKLKESYPDITYKEILWCSLFLLQFQTPDISLIMGYTQSSQYKFKQRLSKKLGLKSVKDLEKMLYEKMGIH